MALGQAPVNSYDQLPYQSYPYRDSHPDLLATVAGMFGMRPSPFAECRVLEIGCGGGGNLIPMAESCPGGRFVGIDLSAGQIASGVQCVQGLGLDNIELRAADIMAVGADYGSFDYIICHGVYSWVPRGEQDKILSICSQNLRPDGVCYVSYNTYPGWRMQGMLRDVMLYHARRFDDPQVRIDQARALLDFLAEVVPAEKSPYGMLLQTEVEKLRTKGDSYLFHEYLEEVNAPLYFHEFVERAEAAGLQYLGEAHVPIMWGGNIPREIERVLKGLSADFIQKEQYTDFVRNRAFRQTLLCHRAHSLQRVLSPEKVTDLYAASRLRPSDKEIDFRSGSATEFGRPQSKRKIAARGVVRAALAELSEAWPASVHFPRLLDRARARCGQEARDLEQADRTTLADSLLHLWLAGSVELSVAPAPFTTSPGEKPLASRLARLQAVEGDEVTNRRHERLRLSAILRELLLQLDGTHSRSDLIEWFRARRSSDGPPEGEAGDDPGRWAALLDRSLDRLGSNALLVAHDGTA